MVSDFDEVARRLKDKYDQKNNQMKELKARVPIPLFLLLIL